MITSIISKVITRVPYVGSIIQGVEITLNTTENIDNSTPLGAVKIISKFLNKTIIAKEITIIILLVFLFLFEEIFFANIRTAFLFLQTSLSILTNSSSLKPK